jgi:hypothetical protein
MKLSRIYYEVSSWAGSKRDGLGRAPFTINDKERWAWADGYKWAMNEVAQHYNMERIKAERQEDESRI